MMIYTIDTTDNKVRVFATSDEVSEYSETLPNQVLRVVSYGMAVEFLAGGDESKIEDAKKEIAEKEYLANWLTG